jgi:hypothetical protein
MPEEPKLVQLAGKGLHVLPDVREYVGVVPAVGKTPARLRFFLMGATTVDVPVSRQTLIALEADVRKYLAKAGS